MSLHETPDTKKFYFRLGGVAFLLLFSALMGLWLGKVSVQEDLPMLQREEIQGDSALDEDEMSAALTQGDLPLPDPPPVRFYVGAYPDHDWTIAHEEIQLAAEAGVHQYAFPVRAPWSGPGAVAPLLESLGQLLDLDPHATVVLRVDLNPPKSWLDAHPGVGARNEKELLPFASPASQVWLDAARTALKTLVVTLEKSNYRNRIEAYVISAMTEGRWYYRSGYDRSTANLEGFKTWLQGKYTDEGVLQEAWGDPDLSYATLDIPKESQEENREAIFYELPEQQGLVDFLTYTSESIADAIALFVSAMKETSQDSIQVHAPYGYAYEWSENHAGHFALRLLLNTDIDGFISPVSYADRGLGGIGALMGLMHSALAHEKRWSIVDDTRTGVARDALTGKITRLKGIRPQDVYNVQRRNFATAVVYGLDLIWSDPNALGWFHDPGQWKEFGAMYRAYANSRSVDPGLLALEELAKAQGDSDGEALLDGDGAPEEFFPLEPEVKPGDATRLLEESTEGSRDGLTLRSIPEPLFMPDDPLHLDDEEEFRLPDPLASSLTVVVDEESRFYQQCAAPLNQLLLHEACAAAYRAGVKTRFLLLDDVIDGVADPSSVYLFLNAFYLPPKKLERLHERLREEKACAIWLYAPGYVGGENPEEHISQVTGMKVRAFKESAQSGSVFLLTGRWMHEGEDFGAKGLWKPLFYIDDKEADVLGQYRDSGKSSVAIRFHETNWTSVYVAEPTLSAGLLREVLSILEQHIYYRPMAQNQYDAIFISDDYLAVHGKKSGERMVGLGRFCDAQDLFQANIGWLKSDSFVMPLGIGETRLLRLTGY